MEDTYSFRGLAECVLPDADLFEHAFLVLARSSGAIPSA
jgi:hypothetical protein